MNIKFISLLLLAFFGLVFSCQAQSKDEDTMSVKLISAECGDFCYYVFKDVSTGEEINLDWVGNDDYSDRDLDDESEKTIGTIESCSYGDSLDCNKVLGKTFIVKVVKKTREEIVATGPMTMETTGKIEVYYNIKNIRAKK